MTKIFFAVMGAVLFLVGCTRPSSSSPSSVAISVPKTMSSQKVGALSFDQIGHIAINVTGDGIANPIIFNWDANESNSKTPPNIVLDIPKGNNRLIQVLAVYVDSSNDSQMQFYYGDKIKTLSNSDETVKISVSNVGAGSNVISGRIAGRFITATVAGADFGPTSTVDIVYNPPGANKPPMIIDQGSITNGWFHFFGLQGAKLGYRLNNGAYLFGGPVELSSASFTPAPNLLRVAAPLRLQKEYKNNVETWVTENPSIYVYGYFGPGSGVATKNVCVVTTPAFSKLATSSNQANLLTLMASADPDLFAADNQNVYYQGGVMFGMSADCSSDTIITSNLYVNTLRFDPTVLENGNDNSATFRGPFVSSGGNWLLTSTVDANTKSISGNLLPGIPHVIDKFVLFKKPVMSSNNSDVADCYSLPSQGFAQVADGRVSNATPNAITPWSMNVPVTPSEISNGVLFALCAVKGGVMGSRGAWLRGDVFSGNGGGGTPAQLLAKLQVPTTGSDYNTEACVPVSALIADSTGVGANMNGQTYTVSATGSLASNVYTSPTCTGTFVNQSMTGLNTLGGGNLFVKMPANAGSYSLGFHASGLTTNLVPINVVTATSYSAIRMVSYNTNPAENLSTLNASAWTCMAYFLQTQDVNGSPIPVSGASISPVWSGSGINHYSDDSCTSLYTPSSATIAIGQSNSQTFYFRLNTSVPIFNWGGSAVVPVTTAMNYAATVTSLAFSFPKSPQLPSNNLTLPANQCTPIEIAFVDGAMNRGSVYVMSTGTAAYTSSTSDLFWYDASCTTTLSSTNFVSSTTNGFIKVYLKTGASGTSKNYTISYSASGGSPAALTTAIGTVTAQ